MRVVFMGTPIFAAVILEYLADQHEVVGVFTRPDTIRGRGKQPLPSAVKEMAHKYMLPVYEYASLRSDEAQQLLVDLNPEVICVAAYGAILPQEVLDLPPYGCLNVHASLLPRWRGAAPIERALLAGDEALGVSIMKMEEGLDTGDFAIARSMEPGDFTAEELNYELADLGASALLVALQQLQMGTISWTTQDESLVTYAEKLEKNELNINPNLSAEQAKRNIQASSSSHPCKCIIAGKEVILIKASMPEIDTSSLENLAPQGMVSFVNKRLYLGFQDGCIELKEVKPAGKKRMEARAFAAGLQGIKNACVEWEAYEA